MSIFRRKGFMAAAAMSALVAIYFALVAGRAVIFIRAEEPLAKALGVAFFVLPVIGVWWLVNEWRLGVAVQRMADELADMNALPSVQGELDDFGRLTPESQAALFEQAKAEVELMPNDWAAWFKMGYAYEANKDRSMARKSWRHAAALRRATLKRKV